MLQINLTLTPQETAYLINLIAERPIKEAAMIHNKVYSAARDQTAEYEQKQHGESNGSNGAS